jgi:hypothetical protein
VDTWDVLIMTEKLIGLYAGIKPNRISLYLLLLQTNRLDELESKLINDMEKDRIKDEETEA